MTERNFSPGPPRPGGELRLPTPPGVLRRFLGRRPWLTDALVAGVYFVPMAALLLFQLVPGAGAEARPWPAVALHALVVAVVAAALLFRRRAPLIVLAVTGLGLLVSSAFAGSGQGDVLPVLIALYAVAVYGTVRSAWIGLAVLGGVGSVGAFALEGFTGPAWPAIAADYAIPMLAATLVGVTIGDRKRYVRSLLDRATQLARERDQQAQLARVSERQRIAREMHDIVAHSLSVMVALADGADAIHEKDPLRSRAAMREVATTGRGSMAEMRRLLGVLGEGPERNPADAAPADAPLNPQPGTAQLAPLVESFRSAGLPARLESSGRAPGNQGVQLTIYRIVQESLTNVLRYSRHPTQVVVRVAYSPGQADVVVFDTGHAAPDSSSAVGGADGGAAAATGAGRGLIGLRERVALYGGTLDAGPLVDGGWRVRARMSYDEEQE